MHDLLQFPHVASSHPIQIPKPANYKPGDRYLLMEFEDGDPSPVGFFPCVKMIVKLGEFIEGQLHAIGTPDGTALSRLRVQPDGRVLAIPLIEGSPDGIYEPGELNALGFVEELWPDGWQGGRWVYNRAKPMEGYGCNRLQVSLKF